MTGTVKNHGVVVQGFAPNRLLQDQTSVDVSTVLAIRVPVSVNYQINGIGPVVAMPPGITVINAGISTLAFSPATDIEIMDE